MFSHFVDGWFLWVDWERVVVHDVVDDAFLLCIVFFKQVVLV